MIYYSNSKVLSYNTPYIFTLGNRSIGKSFSWTEYVINRWQQKRRKFIYMRRYDDDLKKVAPSFFDNNAFKHPETTFSVSGSGKSGTPMLIDGEQAGLTVALSVANKYKSVGFSDYDTIIFDEFLSEDDNYLKSEVSKALSFYMSVARGYNEVIRTNVKFVFIANHISLNNPYFRELKIRDNIQLNTKYTVDTDRAWVVELTTNTEIADTIMETPFGKMMAKTPYGEHALKSKFYLDSPVFIDKPKGNSTYLCTLIWNEKMYGVYEYVDDGFYYITKKADKNCKNVFSLTNKDHKPNLVMIYKMQYNPIYRFLKNAYDYALLRFDSDESKYMFIEFMELSTIG